MRPKPIIQFEWLLFAALALDFGNNLSTWDQVVAKFASVGVTPNPVLVLVTCALSPIVGLIFWYFVARRGSAIAKWIMTIFVAAATIGFILTWAHGIQGSMVTMFAIAATAELLKILAVSRLFAAEARPWFARRAGPA